MRVRYITLKSADVRENGEDRLRRWRPGRPLLRASDEAAGPGTRHQRLWTEHGRLDRGLGRRVLPAAASFGRKYRRARAPQTRGVDGHGHPRPAHAGRATVTRLPGAP